MSVLEKTHRSWVAQDAACGVSPSRTALGLGLELDISGFEGRAFPGCQAGSLAAGQQPRASSGPGGGDRVQVASAEPRGEALQGARCGLSARVCAGSLSTFPGKTVMSGNRVVSQGVIKNRTESTEKWPSPGTRSEFIFY